MEKSKLERISFLSRKSRNETLSEEEIKEQKVLREEYLADIKKDLTRTLSDVYIVDKDGNKTKLKKKEEK